MPENFSLILDWLNENQYRKYPFIDNANIESEITDNVLLDACLVYNDGTSFNSVIALTSISVSGSTYTVSVTDQADFIFIADSNTIFPLYIRNSVGSLLVFGSDLLNITSNTLYSYSVFNPTTCYHFSSSWLGVKSVTADNNTQLTGDVNFVNGIQFDILINKSKNILTLKADLNSGDPTTCDKFFPEIPNDCGTGIEYVDGVSVNTYAGTLYFTAGTNVSIFDDAANHRIYVGLNFKPQDVCPTILPNPKSTI